MKSDRRIKSSIAAGLLGALLAAPVAAAEKAQSELLALHEIMEELGKNMEAVTGAIAREDWGQVAKIAPLIADHPEPPPAEKARILAFLGKDAAKFRGHDEKTHRAAMEMKEAAARQDGPAVISAFAAVQNGCLGCHQNFRKRLREHFYGKR